MKRILTLALLATAASFPAMAEQSAGSSTGLSIGGVGANVDIGASADVDSSANRTSDVTNPGERAAIYGDTNAEAQLNSEKRENIDAQINENTDSRTRPGTTASGSSSASGSASASATGQAIQGRSLARNDVVLIQQALRQEGFYQGTADGVWGPRTASALMQFQQQNSLGATGSLNSTTLDQLGVQLNSSASASGSSSSPVGSPAEGTTKY